MNHLISLLILVLLPAPLLAQTADPRAVAECTRLNATIVSINDCLPDAHVAVIVIDKLGEVYGDAGKSLMKQCLERNHGNMVGGKTCATEAIRAAVALAAKLPAGSVIPDPLYEGLRKPGDLAVLDAAEKAAQKTFPEKGLWGFTMYFSLK